MCGQQEGEYIKMHDLYETNDLDAPECIKDRNGEVILGLCKKCGRAEIELEELCGEPIQRRN